MGTIRTRMIRTLLIASLATLAATEAEPKAEADPYLIYGGYPYTHGLTHGLTYGAYNPYYTLPVVKAAEAEVKAVDAEEKKTVVPLHYPINYGYYGHYSPLTHYYGKREAEAEPTADADADAKADPWLAYSGYAGYPYAYGHSGYLPYVSHPVVKSVVKAADGEKKTVVPYALPYGGLYNYGYGYSGYPVVKTVAGKHIVSPLTTYHHLGKRSAEAEPEADAEAEADPWLAYGYSGYGHGLGYGYGLGHGYRRSYYGGYPYRYGYGGYGYPYYG